MSTLKDRALHVLYTVREPSNSKLKDPGQPKKATKTAPSGLGHAGQAGCQNHSTGSVEAPVEMPVVVSSVVVVVSVGIVAVSSVVVVVSVGMLAVVEGSDVTEEPGYSFGKMWELAC